jgi:hypothetical protein
MIARGLASAGSLLAGGYRRVIAVRAADGPMPRRDIYALLPSGDRHPHAHDVLGALRETAFAYDVTGAGVEFPRSDGHSDQPLVSRS